MRRRKVSKEQILKKAAELFSKKGFHLTKIEDITESLSIAKGTFYLYFKSKEELLRKIILNLHQEIYSINKSIIESVGDWVERFEKLILESLKFIKDKMVFIRVFVEEGLWRQGIKKMSDFDEIMRMERRDQNKLVEFFKEGIRKGNLSNFFSPEEVSLFFTFIIRSRVFKYIFDKKKFNIKKECEIFKRFFLEGAGR